MVGVAAGAPAKGVVVVGGSSCLSFSAEAKPVRTENPRERRSSWSFHSRARTVARSFSFSVSRSVALVSRSWNLRFRLSRDRVADSLFFCLRCAFLSGASVGIAGAFSAAEASSASIVCAVRAERKGRVLGG